LISATSSGSGIGGSIQIDADGELKLLAGSCITTDALGSGQGGSVTITADDGVYINGTYTVTGGFLSGVQPFIKEVLPSSFVGSTATIPQPGQDGYTYYSFGVTSVGAGKVALFDIDGGWKNTATSRIDTIIFLFDQNGQLLASSDDSLADPGSLEFCTGCFYTYDSYLSYAFPKAGTYVLGVGEYYSYTSSNVAIPLIGNVPNASQSYSLLMSLSDPNILPNTVFTAPSTLGQDFTVQSGISARSQSTGAGGDIKVNTEYLNLSDRSEITATTQGLAKGGTITLNIEDYANSNLPAAQGISLNNSSITTAVEDNANNTANDSQGGSITIHNRIGLLTLENNSSITTQSLGLDPAGDIDINIADDLTVHNSLISTSSNQGLAGNIILSSTTNSSDLLLEGNFTDSTGATSLRGVLAQTTGGGTAGSITLGSSASPLASVTINPGAEIAVSAIDSTPAQRLGNAGNITVTTARLNLQEGQISAATQGNSANHPSNSPLTPANITLNTPSFTANNNSLISASTDNGIAGSVTVGSATAPATTVSLTNSTIEAKAIESSGNAGSVNIASRTLSLTESNLQTNNVSGTTLNSNINLTHLTSPLVLTDSNILASTERGQAGSIFINANDAPLAALTLTGGSTISVAAGSDNNATTGSGGGQAGQILIKAQTVTLDGSNGGQNASDRATISAATEAGSSQGITLPNLTRLFITQGDITASTFDGNAPTLTIGQATLPLESITLNNGTLSVAATGSGNSGQVNLYTRALTARNQSQVSASTNSGTSRSITLPDLETLELTNSRIQATTTTGTAGSINITSNQSIQATGTLADGSPGGISVQATQGGQAGNLTLITPQLILGQGSAISAAAEGTAIGGNITLQPGSQGSLGVQMEGGASITASTKGSGAGGSLLITAPQVLSLQGAGTVAVESSAGGAAGSITVTAPQVSLRDRATLSASTTGSGSAGNITLTAQALTLDSRAIIQSSTRSSGNAGDITIATDTLRLNNGAQILAETSGSGAGGTITADGRQQVRLGDGGQEATPVISVETSGAGRAGGILIRTPDFVLAQTARITATATATATTQEGGGSIILSADRMDLAGVVGIFAETQGQAPAGTLTLAPYQANPRLDITLFPGSTISASTSGSGNGGDFRITAPQVLTIAGAGTLAVETRGIGNAGNIEITAPQLTLRDGVQVSASTYGSGRAGNITLTSENLTLQEGASVSTNTYSSGTAGDIKVTATGDIDLNGGSIEATTSLDSTGNGGNIDIDPVTTRIRNGGRIAVDSQGQGTGGSIRLVSGDLLLDNGNISAVTRSSNGGNITLTLGNWLRMTGGSYISTEAGTSGSGGNGGDITIRSRFVVAFPGTNSDIIANAFEGAGGNITIETNGIFGFLLRNVNDPRQDRRNNLTASSRFGTSGTVNTTAVDPSKGVNALAVDLVDPSSLIDRRCTLQSKALQSSFTIAGRGGLAVQPGAALNFSPVLGDLRLLAEWSEDGGESDPSSGADLAEAPPSQGTILGLTLAEGVGLGPSLGVFPCRP
jgi:large exoprotein involved in heme utilization and adhesion